MIFDLSKLETQDKYRLLSGGVTPRPIAWISTRSIDGVDNLAPYSFFTVASCNPPVLLYTQVSQGNGIDKDTLHNLRETRECVVNIVSAAQVEKTNMTSAGLANDQSEFAFANIVSCNSHNVSALSVQDSPMHFECTLREIIDVGELPASGSVVLLDVNFVYVKDDIFIDGFISQELIDSVGKMGGDFFSYTSQQVELVRP
jgi:flavin reductase (DIM6/NTAB) family NADH-FMN oxidoreductase RutF